MFWFFFWLWFALFLCAICGGNHAHHSHNLRFEVRVAKQTLIGIVTGSKRARICARWDTSGCWETLTFLYFAKFPSNFHPFYFLLSRCAVSWFLAAKHSGRWRVHRRVCYLLALSEGNHRALLWKLNLPSVCEDPGTTENIKCFLLFSGACRFILNCLKAKKKHIFTHGNFYI